jgi:solute carrier family 25 carnitine/acylcarnitine transporter 20/29
MEQGVSGLYRGVAAPLMAVTPAFAVSFWSYDLAGKAIRRAADMEERQELTTAQVALAGACSGMPLAVIFGPTDRIKCLMQVDSSGKYRGFSDCLLKTYRDGGIRSVFRGTGSCALRDVPGNAAYFGAYEVMKRLSCQLEGREKASTFGTLMAGGCAGVANWIVAIPVDTLKSRLQTAPSGTYNGLFDVFQTLVRNEGPTALFRGLSPALLRAFPANAACLCGVETVKGLLER